MKKKKILLCNDLLINGGAEVLLQIIATGLVTKGFDVTIMCRAVAYDELKNSTNSLFPSGIHFIKDRYPTKKYKYFPILSFANLLFRKVYRMAVVIRVNLKRYDGAAAMLEGHLMKDVASLKVKKRIAWIQCDYERYHTEDRYWRYFSGVDEELRCLKKFDKIVCVSETLKEGVIRAIGDTGNLCVRYNPIDVNGILTSSKEKCEYIKDISRMLIVSVGRLHATKNYKTLLEACSLIKDKAQFNLWIIGDGQQKEELEEYIRKNNLTNVRLLGYHANPYPLLKQGDLYVSTSITESYGLAVQEALILGIPVVAVKNSGIIESLDTEFGVLVDNSAEEISREILHLIDNPDVLSKYRESIRKNYPINSLYEDRMEKICQLFE